MVVFSKAFDTPYETSVGAKTDGWWRLVENAEYKNSTEYIFEEKGVIAEKFDLQENRLSLPEPTASEYLISKPHIGVILSFLVGVKRSNYSLSEIQLDTLLKASSDTFSKAVILYDINIDFTDEEISDLNQFLIKAEARFDEISVIFLEHVNVSHYFSFMLSSKKTSKISTFYLACDSSSGDPTIDKVSDKFVSNRQQGLINVGCAFNISVCGSFKIMSNTENESLQQTFYGKHVRSIAFLYEEVEETVKLGANRMFSQRLVIFEQCRKIILENTSVNKTEVLKISFVLINYATDKQFYSNPWALQTFVKYWEMLRKWSTSSKITVILGNALDGTRVLPARKLPVTQIGWWRILRSAENTKWINKRQDAISVAKGIILTKGTDAKGVDLNYTSASISISTQQVVLIAISTVAICVAVALLIVLFIRSRHQDHTINKDEIDGFMHGIKLTQLELAENRVETARSPYVLPYDKLKYELQPGDFSVDFGKILGSGEFGLVLRGKVEKIPGEIRQVAVKVINESKFHKNSITGLLAQIKVLAFVGKHDHIIELIGANTTDIMIGKVFVFLELCELGSLEKYLRKLQPELLEEYDENYTINGCPNEQYYENLGVECQHLLDPSLIDEFYRWSIEICSAMVYLSSKHVVHADLATRNVLLNSNKQAKICDFGLSRRMYNYKNYVKTKQEPLPWKWMSPESLKMNEFHEKSDVWAFGVLLWEIYSLGDTPYPGLSWDANFVRVLEGGLRLGQPKYDNQNMYSHVMTECWKLSPLRRPSFADILLKLSSLDIEK